MVASSACEMAPDADDLALQASYTDGGPTTTTDAGPKPPTTPDAPREMKTTSTLALARIPDLLLLEGLQFSIGPELDHFASIVFEQVCQQYFWRMGLEGKLPFAPRQIGGWWQANREVDLVLLRTSGKWASNYRTQFSSGPFGSFLSVKSGLF